MKLSIVIVNYNVEYFLEQCLNSVRDACKDLECEVFVVDNQSVDGSVKMVEERFPEVKLIANKENLGFSRANNQAMRLAKGDYVLLLNPDTVIQEDSLRKVVDFMDKHPDAGGLGVRMVDGKGNYLPESKRGLPTPEVAFYKIFGLTSLFSRSKRFARYYLGHLPENEVNEIEILSGAFMLMRKKALDEVGLLDEAFFMYGEDIDLSWRIIQGGYKNYYFPETTIIHYKGESTKKGSLNYVFVFYNAMIIFARKHFSKQRAKLFSFFINLAIYLRATLAVISRTVKQIALPFADLCMLLIVLYGAKELYTDYTSITYSPDLVRWGFISYSFVWMLSVWLSGGYDKPYSIIRIIRGVVLGSALILIGYALLSEDLRFSRALILLGSIGALLVYVLGRWVISRIHPRAFPLLSKKSKRYGIVGSGDEFSRVRSLLEKTSQDVGKVMHIDIKNSEASRIDPQYLDEFIRVHGLNEIIFCAKDMPSQLIIGLMSDSGESIDYKIAPPESMYLIGSNSIDTAGDLLVLDMNSVAKSSNRRSKRLLDLFLSLSFLMLSPLFIWFMKKPLGYLRNIFKVLFGQWTWVGYAKSPSGHRLPKVAPGVLNPISATSDQPGTESIDRGNIIYAKDYHIRNDLGIIFRSFRNLGNTPSVLGEN